jgi:hypothetical protein
MQAGSAGIRGFLQRRLGFRCADCDTAPLFWWLYSLGPDAEIMKPAALRRKMSDRIHALAGRYN